MDEQVVISMYKTTQEIANHFDRVRNIEMTIKYSFKLCQEDSECVIGVTKIVYWASYFKKYDDIIKLLGLIKGNKTQIDKLKEIFFRENKFSIKDLLVEKYIECLKEKRNNGIVMDYVDTLEKFYRAYIDWDVYDLYDLLTEELKTKESL